jgi:secreted trypsin-like serine protease
MKILSLFALLFVTLPLHAWIIGNSTKPSGEESVCRILYRNQEGKLTSICSGTLINSKHVITAAHCINTIDKPSVECGYQGVDANQKIELSGGGSRVVTTGSKFKEVRTDVVPRREDSADPDDSNYDVGIIELKTEITSIKPASFNTSGRSEFINEDTDASKIKPDSECKIEGYGIANDGNSGKLNSGPMLPEISLFEGAIVAEGISMMTEVSSDQIVKLDSCFQTYQDEMIPGNFIPLAKLLAANKVFESGLTHGDSGGPLFCRKKGALNWTIVGIASRSGFGKSGPKTASTNSEWHLFSQEDWDVLVNGKVRPPRAKEPDIDDILDKKN